MKFKDYLTESSKNEAFKWDDINNALMDAGVRVPTIRDLLSNIKDKEIGSGRNGKFQWEDINRGLIASGVRTVVIRDVLSNLNKRTK